MSYEGFVQAICNKGHYYEFANLHDRGENKCPYCGQEGAWRNDVDDTNLDLMGEIPISWLVQLFAVGKDDNGYIFRVPSSETNPLRCFFAKSQCTYAPINKVAFEAFQKQLGHNLDPL